MSLKKKVVWLPYDMDTANGINNDGELVFDYQLEDIDYQRSGAPIFNGQDSVIWKNIRAAFGDELRTMYQNLRSSGALSYAKVEQMFEEHQSKWSEAIFNEDSQFKYIEPFVTKNANYLYMLLGSKEEQRKWWLYNRFRYIDSKYIAGDARSDSIFLRPYAAANITLTPYADIYGTIAWDARITQSRAQRNVPVTLICPYQTMNGNIVTIYSSSQLALIGDLSPLQIGQIDISNAIRLQALKIGSSASGYDNSNLYSLTFGNNVLLKIVDVRNCSGLGDTSLQGHTQTTVDLSGCSILEEVYFDGTKVQGVTLPNGGVLRVLHLPNTITNLTIMNQKNITDLSVPSYASLTTLRLENVPTVNTKTILNAVPASTRVRLIGFSWEAADATEIEALFDKLDTMRGLTESGETISIADGGCRESINGTIHTDSLTGAQIASYQARYPYLTITADSVTSYLTYASYDGTTTYKTVTCVNGVPQEGAPSNPSRPATPQNTFTFVGWSKTMNATTADADAATNVIADRTIYAAYSVQGRTYTVYFYNGSTLLETDTGIPYGGSTTYNGSTPVDPSGQSLPFESWEPAPTNIVGDTSCYAQFQAPEPEHTITDTWAEIFQHIALGDYATRYSIGDTMSLDMGSEGYINAQIVAFDTDVRSSDGTTTVPITWVFQHVLKTDHRMNPALVTNYKYESNPSFKRGSTSTGNGNYNMWDSQNAYTANNTAKITFNVTAVADGTLRLIYLTGASGNYTTSLKVDGTEVVSAYSTTDQNYDLAITNGTTYVIEYEVTTKNSTSSTSTYIKLCDTSGSGRKTAVSALVTQNSVTIENCLVRAIDDYESSTGAIGGYAASEMRQYVQETLKPLIPAEVRQHIVSVKKYTRSYDTSGTFANNVESSEDVWLLSLREMNFSVASETTGPNYSTAFPDSASRIKYKSGASSASRWWLRSAYNSTNFCDIYTTGGSMNISASSSEAVVLGFCTA